MGSVGKGECTDPCDDVRLMREIMKSRKSEEKKIRKLYDLFDGASLSIVICRLLDR